MALVREMPVAAVANVVVEHDTRLWRVVRHYVGRAHDRQDWGRAARRGGSLALCRASSECQKHHNDACMDGCHQFDIGCGDAQRHK